MTSTATSWTVTLEEDPETGDLILPFPADFLKIQGWAEGDSLEWIKSVDGSWIIQKVKSEK
jgi:hypothetical protein